MKPSTIYKHVKVFRTKQKKTPERNSISYIGKRDRSWYIILNPHPDEKKRVGDIRLF